MGLKLSWESKWSIKRREQAKTDVSKIEHGLVAQLGERRVRNAEVEGSIPFESTNLH